MATSTTTKTAPRKRTAVSRAKGATPQHNKPKFTLSPVRMSTWLNPKEYEHYIQRKVRGVTDFTLFDGAFMRHENILLEGPTQSGKTTAVYAWGAKRGLRLANVPSNVGADPTDLIGDWLPTSDNSLYWQDGPVTDVVRNGGLLLINEVNFLPEEIKTIMYSLLDYRRVLIVPKTGEILRVHDGGEDCWCGKNPGNDPKTGKPIDPDWKDMREPDKDGVLTCNRGLAIFVDMNPDYYGTHALNHAFRARFAHPIPWDYNRRVEERLIPYPAILRLAEQIRGSEEFETPCGTGMLKQFVEDYRYLGMQYARENFVDRFSADEREPMRHIVNTHIKEIEADLKSVERLTPLGEAIVQPKSAVGLPGRGTANYDKGEWAYDDDIVEDDEEFADDPAAPPYEFADMD